MACVSARFDEGQWDISLFDYICPTIAVAPKLITTSTGERIKSTVSIGERTTSSITTTE